MIIKILMIYSKVKWLNISKIILMKYQILKLKMEDLLKNIGMNRSMFLN
jgi:hypothetical protein